MAKYHCKNFGSCPKADAHEELEIAPGMDPLCPECGMTLTPAEAQADGPVAKKWMVPGVIGVVAVVMAGGGYYAYSTYIEKPTDAVHAAVDLGKTATDLAKLALSARTTTEPGSAPSAGPQPDEARIQALKKESETRLVKGDGAGAEAASRRAAALEMIKTAVAYLAQGDLSKAEQELNAAKERDPDQALVYYNLAVVRVKQQRVEDAMALLETSFSKGFNGVAEMERDPDLKPLRKDERYQAMVARYKKG